MRLPPAGPGLVDRYGRVHRDLRVSVTDRCNLRCLYCMPEEGVPVAPDDDLLSFDEIVRVVRVATGLGVRAVRLTGGEPLLRPGLAELVGAIAALPAAPEISMTTNGTRLAQLAPALAGAGLRRVNVSLDTLRPEVFRRLTRRQGLPRVLEGLAAARDAGLRPVKVNAVLQRGCNDGEAADLLAYCLAQGYELRFIEQMPLDAGHRWRRRDMVTADEILDRLRERFHLEPEPESGRGSSPAAHYVVDGGPARVGIVAAVTRPFCGSCDRLRLTADGQIRHCLFARRESDLRTLLRDGADDEAIVAVLRAAVRAKPAGHGIDDPAFLQPARPMSAIGG